MKNFTTTDCEQFKDTKIKLEPSKISFNSSTALIKHFSDYRKQLLIKYKN